MFNIIINAYYYRTYWMLLSFYWQLELLWWLLPGMALKWSREYWLSLVLGGKSGSRTSYAVEILLVHVCSLVVLSKNVWLIQIELKVTDPPRTGVKVYHFLHVKRLFQAHQWVHTVTKYIHCLYMCKCCNFTWIYRKDEDEVKGKREMFVRKIINYIFPYSKGKRVIDW